MITIKDFDDPITIAQKLIHGTKESKVEEEKTAAEKISDVIAKSLGFEGGCEDILSKGEIKELADYLMIWWENNKDNDMA